MTPTKRKEYDEVRRLGPMAGGFGGAPGGFGGRAPRAGSGSRTWATSAISSAGLFGGRPRVARRARAQQRGADLETELHLSFEDAVQGVTTTVNLPEDTRCHTCKGSGAAPGTSTHTCDRCGGQGTLDDNQGLFSLSTVCPKCNGRGTLVDTPCPTCHGTGTERRTRRVKVRVPAGVYDGQRIRVKGRGSPGQGSGPPGDLYVVVRVGRHATFGRRGKNLTLTVAGELPRGRPRVDGDRAHPRRHGDAAGAAGDSSGTVAAGPRPRGAGRQDGDKPGDLLVKVDVAVPSP